MNSQVIGHRKIFSNHSLMKDFYPEYIKDSQNPIIRKKMNLKMDKRYEQILHQEDMHIANKHMKKYSQHPQS